MKKAISIILVMALCLSPAAAAFAESEANEIDYTTGKPWLDVDLEGNVTADIPTDPKDNFALWANKDRILSMEIPEGYIAAGNTTDADLKGTEDMKALFHGEAPEAHDSRLAYDYYYLVSDWDARDARGVEPLKEMVDLVEGITSLAALREYFVKTPWEDRLYCLWKESNVQDTENAGYNVLSIKNGYSLLKDPAEYIKLSADGEMQKETYEAFFGRMLEKLGYSEKEAKQKFDNCFAWETMLNSVLANEQDESGSAYKTDADNYYTRGELLAVTPNIPILETLEKADGYPVMDRYLIPVPAVIEKLNALYTEENLPLMRDYLILHGIFENTEALDWESYTLINDCQEMISSGCHYELDKESYADSLVYDDVILCVAWPVSKLYVEKHANSEDKARLLSLVEEIINAYYGIIADADFISDETRAGAYAKLDNMTRNVLYPDSWEPYSFEDVDFASKEEGGSLWEAWRAIKKHEHDKNVSAVTGPFDRTLWDALPFKGGCSYTPSVNGIYINAAFAQDPNYRPDMPVEELYAYMGAAIAHEISHAFDAEGAKYDKDGNLINWWTDEDLAAFKEKNEKLAAYYNAMHPWEGQDFNGENMVGEACADMAALKCILRIAAEKQGFDYDKFFRAYADRCAVKETLAMAMARLEDEHPMNYLRINANLQQYDEFLNFYGITEGDKMYLAPEDRVAIW